MDTISIEKRRLIMSRVKGADTQPEKIVRSMLHKMGYRFRIHRKDLPGKPDIVLPKYKSIIFIHGCFWHRHNCSNGVRVPKSNQEYWIPKLENNKIRDEKNQTILLKNGWKILIVWECMLKDKVKLTELLKNFLT